MHFENPTVMQFGRKEHVCQNFQNNLIYVPKLKVKYFQIGQNSILESFQIILLLYILTILTCGPRERGIITKTGC